MANDLLLNFTVHYNFDHFLNFVLHLNFQLSAIFADFFKIEDEVKGDPQLKVDGWPVGIGCGSFT